MDEPQGRASRHRARPRAVEPGGGAPWPGSATPLPWVMALLASGAAAGALLGVLLGLLSPQSTTVSALVEIRPESAILGGTPTSPLTIEQTNSLVTTEVARLTTLAEDVSDSPDTVDVTQVGTSALVQISATTPDEQGAIGLVSGLVDTYVTDRRAVVEQDLRSQQDAVADRLQEITAAGGGASGSAEQEIQRLLSRQSDLAEAISQLDRLVPVVRPAAEDATSAAAPNVVLYGVGGAALGGALVLGLGALWRARSSRLFDARQLAAAGIPLLHPRIPAGSLRARRRGMDLTQPADDVIASARLLARQVFGTADGPQVVLLTGVCDLAGTEQVAWSLAWAVSSDRPVTVLAVLPDPADVPAEGRVTQVTSAITAVEFPVGADDAPLVAAGSHTAGGSHLLLCIPPLTGSLSSRGLVGRVDSALLVVGEGACTVEHALAAAQGFEADEGAAARGVVVTTPQRWKSRGRGTHAEAAAPRRDPSPPTTRRAADGVTARSG